MPTNPTHFAIALKYDMDGMAAPVVVAKGVDYLAKRIRQVAETHASTTDPDARLYRKANGQESRLWAPRTIGRLGVLSEA